MKSFLFALPFVFSLSTEAKTLKVMQYNVENFFDTTFDQGTKDYTYLPLSVKKTLPNHSKLCKQMGSNNFIRECLNLDWNDTKFTNKAKNVAKVIKAFDSSETGADIVILEEVENLNVLNKIVSEGLTTLGYTSKVLIDGDDDRGIDVAVISKFPVISSVRHSIFINGTKLDTRGILEVALNVNGKTVVVFANHWPSQSNPTEHRIASAKVLAERAESVKADLIIAAGDFNTLETEKPHPFDSLRNFTDTEAEARRLGVEMNGGTHYYQGHWSSLDHIFVHSKSTFTTNFQKFQILNRSFLMRKDNRTGDLVPFRANAQKGEGFSDHLPMGIEFIY